MMNTPAPTRRRRGFKLLGKAWPKLTTGSLIYFPFVQAAVSFSFVVVCWSGDGGRQDVILGAWVALSTVNILCVLASFWMWDAWGKSLRAEWEPEDRAKSRARMQEWLRNNPPETDDCIVERPHE